MTGSPRSATGSPRLGLDRRDRRRVLVAVGVGLAGELAALGLLTTGAWLLLSASLRPPILLLSIAIGAVQLFSFLRGTARFVERLAEHCPKRPQVPIGDVQRQVSARCRCVERAAEEPERLGGEAPGGARVCDAARGRRLDLRE